MKTDATDQPADFPLRYVVLHHTGIDSPHFDFMVETALASRLATWRTSHWPVSAGQGFEPLDLHRREYLDYEGPVSGNRGHVKRIAVGCCRVVLSSPLTWTIELQQGISLSLPVKHC
jgi:hypothetical protein